MSRRPGEYAGEEGRADVRTNALVAATTRCLRKEVLSVEGQSFILSFVGYAPSSLAFFSQGGRILPFRIANSYRIITVIDSILIRKTHLLFMQERTNFRITHLLNTSLVILLLV